MNDEIRRCVTKSITDFSSLKTSIPLLLHATLTDVNKTLESFELYDTLHTTDVLTEIKKLCELHTNINDADLSEYLDLVKKYTNAIEMFIYFKLNQIQETDLAKLLIINDLSYALAQVDDAIYV